MRQINARRGAKILMAAVEVFAKKGLKGATIRAIGKRAGVNSALIYYYYGNKQTLFIESIKYILRGFFEQLESELKRYETAEERLAFLVNGIFNYYARNPQRLRLMGVVLVMHSELVGKVIRQFLRERSSLPLQVVAEGIAMGQLRRANPVQVWWTVLGACMLSIKMHQVVNNKSGEYGGFEFPSVEESRSQIIQLLCYGLKNNGKRMGEQ
ncbi:MAG: TetR/AcrR family transcriptional regulator [Verrucomicrobiia bacterium]